jgi:hypothetical protein
MEATWNGALFSAATIRLPVSTHKRRSTKLSLNGSYLKPLRIDPCHAVLRPDPVLSPADNDVHWRSYGTAYGFSVSLVSVKRIRLTSCCGGKPKSRLYSRLNWDALS